MALIGFGAFLTAKRESVGMTVDQLAERIGRSPATIRRIEAEITEPSVEQINALVAALPISAEQLLKEMGVSLTPPTAARLPKRLVELLLELDPTEQEGLIRLLGRGA